MLTRLDSRTGKYRLSPTPALPELNHSTLQGRCCPVRVDKQGLETSPLSRGRRGPFGTLMSELRLIRLPLAESTRNQAAGVTLQKTLIRCVQGGRSSRWAFGTRWRFFSINSSDNKAQSFIFVSSPTSPAPPLPARGLDGRREERRLISQPPHAQKARRLTAGFNWIFGKVSTHSSSPEAAGRITGSFRRVSIT
ncbi:hypothetical protein AOLI_G00282630 [Acnodon oligacanthus]